MVTGMEVVTALVLTVKFVLVAPAATVTLAGSVAAEALLERETRAPATATRPSRWREVRIKLQSIDITASQANNDAHVSHRRIGGAYRGKAKGGANERAAVVNVTVAVAAFFPSSVTGEGETVHVAWAGAPVQLQVTV